MRLIGLSGYGGVGKDTVADIMCNRLGYQKFSFSDDLYRQVAMAFDVSVQFLQDRSVKEEPQPKLALQYCTDSDFVRAYRSANPGSNMHAPVSPRRILQEWGTSYRRMQDPDYWLKRAAAWLEKFSAISPRTGFVNTSVRFENEAQWVRDQGGVVVRIVRGIAPPNSFVSEVGLPDHLVDYEINNAGSLSELGAVVVNQIVDIERARW